MVTILAFRILKNMQTVGYSEKLIAFDKDKGLWCDELCSYVRVKYFHRSPLYSNTSYFEKIILLHGHTAQHITQSHGGFGVRPAIHYQACLTP